VSVSVFNGGAGIGFELVGRFAIVIKVEFAVDYFEHFRVSPGNLAGGS
jgi:hypothetical protein